MNKPSWFWSGVVILMRPWLWRSALRFVPNNPWKPSSWRLGKYIAFRMTTMYGDPKAKPTPADTIRFFKWCRSFNNQFAND